MGQEEAEGEMQVQGGAGALDGFAQQEGEGRQEEAQQRQAQPGIGDHSEHGILLLRPNEEDITVTLYAFYKLYRLEWQNVKILKAPLLAK